MPALEFVGPSARDEEQRPHGTSRLVNVFPVPGERSPVVLRPVPGTASFGTLDGIFCRALAVIEDQLYAVQGGTLWRVAQDGSATSLMDGLPNDPATTLHGLEGWFITVAGGAYKVLTAEGEVVTPEMKFGSASSGLVMTRRVVLTERGGREFQWSDVGDPETLNALSFATAEQTDEDIIRAFAVGGELWLFKAHSIERWYASGSDPAFSYIPGSLIPWGLKDYRLICAIPGGAFFVGSDGKAYLAGGGQATPISTDPVETSLADATPEVCFAYRHEGRTFACITFRDRPAWCCDLASGLWHERAQGAGLGRWEAMAAAEAYGRQVLGTDTGPMLAVGGHTDAGAALHKVIVSKTIQNGGKPFRVPYLELQAATGAGSVTDDRSRAPQVRLRVSGDHGRTWAERPARSLGEEGAYDTRLVWRALGQFRAFTVEMRCAEALDVSFDALAFAEMG